MSKAEHKKVGRRKNTPEARAFWKAVERNAKEVRKLPKWKRAGISGLRERGQENSE